MKIYPFKIPKVENSSLIVQEDRDWQLYNKLHQHEEIQLSLIKKGEGRCIIGDFVGDFKEGEIYVIGSNLPHVFDNERGEEKAHMISLFFTRNSFGNGFFDLPDFIEFASFFERSKRGFVPDDNSGNYATLIDNIPSMKQLDRFTNLLYLLQGLSKIPYRSLASVLHSKSYGEEEGKRMQNIMDFTLANFDQNISLEQISSIANMTPNAFCRYFKQRTNKTYFNFLIEMRIAHACKLLRRNKDLSISEISYQSGFNNLTNFNRKFKALKALSPSEFRKKS